MKLHKFHRSNKENESRLDCRVETQENIDWDTVYHSSFLCTKISKLIVFQFRLLHRRLATNSFLTKNKPKKIMSSALSAKMIQRLLLFTSSGLVAHPLFFWQDFKQWAVNRGELSNTINLTAYLVLGLNPNENKRLDFYFLVARLFLWVCKTRNTFPKIENFSLFPLTLRHTENQHLLTSHWQGHAHVFYSVSSHHQMNF